jgi:uncharacterized protein YllA (UPF0747 family)
MATKKQKREAALAKREQFLKEEAERGLEAQKASKIRQTADEQLIKEVADSINDLHREILGRHGIHE